MDIANIRVRESDYDKTAFATQCRLYEFFGIPHLVLPLHVPIPGSAPAPNSVICRVLVFVIMFSKKLEIKTTSLIVNNYQLKSLTMQPPPLPCMTFRRASLSTPISCTWGSSLSYANTSTLLAIICISGAFHSFILSKAFQRW